MIRFLLVLTVTMATALSSPRDEAQSILRQYADAQGTAHRMDRMSSHFLGLPYGDGGPLGEGPLGRYDQDPLYRFDTFDCTTYVETIVSLALSQDADRFEEQMDEIRYHNAVVDFLTRNHDPSLHWIPHNVDNGLLSEINERIAPPDQIKLASAIINVPGWLRSLKIGDIKVPRAPTAEKKVLLKELHDKAALFSPVRSDLGYVPVDYLLKHPERLDLVPQGSIVNFVRPNWDLTTTAGTHMNVSHQGLLFWKGGVLYLRHASVAAPKIVMELPFIEYLKRFENHPTLKGVHFMQVTRP